MVVTTHGVDARLMEAAQAVLLARSARDGGGRPLTLPRFLRRRCVELLAACPTTLEEDEAALAACLGGDGSGGSGGEGVGGASGDSPAALALRFRAGKKRVLTATLAALEDAE